QHVAVGGVGAVMLAFEVTIETADLLPLHDREDSIQSIEVRDLDIGCVDVLDAATGEGDALPRMIALLRRTGGHPKDAPERPLVELEAHADIHERGADRLKLFDDQPLRITCVE